MDLPELFTLLLLYIVAPLALLLGVMFVIRRRRDKESGRPPSQKIDDLKAEERKGEKKV